MIFKDADDRSGDLAELERLADEVPHADRAAVTRQIKAIRSGIAGERDAAHFINREFGHSERLALIHDLRFETGDGFAQIDHLVIHRFQAKAWVLETKNYSGRLVCDEHGDWTVWLNGKPRPIASPINQARRQCIALRKLLDRTGGKAIREIQPVVLISPTSSIDRRHMPDDISIVKSDNFAAWWNAEAEKIGFGHAFGLAGRHLLGGYSQEAFTSLCEALVAAHVLARTDWRARLNIAASEPQATAHSAAPVSSPSSKAIAGEIQTSLGWLKLSQIPDGRFSLRNEKSEELINVVRDVCRGQAQWVGRYGNWLIDEERVADIMESIEQRANSTENSTRG
jgi:hypothetical protein